MANQPLNQKNTKPILSLKEVSSYLGVHEITVYRMLKSHTIPAFKIGGQWRFKRAILDEWIEDESLSLLRKKIKET